MLNSQCLIFFVRSLLCIMHWASPSHEIEEIDSIAFLDLQAVPLGTIYKIVIHLYTDHFGLLHIVLLD